MTPADSTGVELAPPVVEIYKLVKMELKIESFNLFEEEISKLMASGWKPQGGIDVKTTSTSGWLLTQAMVKEK